VAGPLPAIIAGVSLLAKQLVKRKSKSVVRKRSSADSMKRVKNKSLLYHRAWQRYEHQMKHGKINKKELPVGSLGHTMKFQSNKAKNDALVKMMTK
jgi:hypothetical protein